jgi:hypothetical protein
VADASSLESWILDSIRPVTTIPQLAKLVVLSILAKPHWEGIVALIPPPRP